MRVALFKNVNITDLENSPVELSELHLKVRLQTSFRLWFSGNRIIRLMNMGVEDKKIREKMALVEEIKIVILNNLANAKGESRVKRIRIPRTFEGILNDVLNSSEFIAFKITRIYENQDILQSFPDLPILLEFEVV